MSHTITAQQMMRIQAYAQLYGVHITKTEWCYLNCEAPHVTEETIEAVAKAAQGEEWTNVGKLMRNTKEAWND